MDLAELRESWARRWDAEEARDLEAREQAMTRLPLLVELLVKRFGARAVVLVGSLARGPFRADSDIDLVVAGLSATDFWRAGVALEDAAGRHVDLIPWEDISDEMRHTVADHGRLLHGVL